MIYIIIFICNIEGLKTSMQSFHVHILYCILIGVANAIALANGSATCLLGAFLKKKVNNFASLI